MVSQTIVGRSAGVLNRSPPSGDPPIGAVASTGAFLRRRLVGDVKSGDSYALVLVLLLASLVVAIVVPETTWARLVRDAILSVTLVVTFWTSTRAAPSWSPAFSFPAPRSSSSSLARSKARRPRRSRPRSERFWSPGRLSRRPRSLPPAPGRHADRVRRALALRPARGFLFGLVYSFIADVSGDAFFTRGDDGTSGEHLYYSFVAISTTGFGDLAPATGLGRALTVLEIVLGQMYLVTVVAVLVTAATGRQLMTGRARLDD